MSSLRRIPFAAHGAVEFPLGLVLMAAPFVIGADPAGTVVAVALGALIAGMALSSLSGPRNASMRVSAHEAYDQALGLGGIGGAVALTVAGELPVALAVLVCSLVLLGLTFATRYTTR